MKNGQHAALLDLLLAQLYRFKAAVCSNIMRPTQDLNANCNLCCPTF
jgi:hypothetical protein